MTTTTMLLVNQPSTLHHFIYDFEMDDKPMILLVSHRYTAFAPRNESVGQYTELHTREDQEFEETSTIFFLSGELSYALWSVFF